MEAMLGTASGRSELAWYGLLQTRAAANNVNSGGSEPTSNVGPIVGGIIAAVVLVLIVVSMVFKRQADQKRHTEQFEADASDAMKEFAVQLNAGPNEQEDVDEFRLQPPGQTVEI